jgi:hypothetical protein
MMMTSLAGVRTVSVSAKRGKRTHQKSKRKKTHNAQDLCLAQVDECLDMINVLCRDRADPAQCEAPLLPCCQHLAACAATATLSCMFPTPAPPESATALTIARLR